MRFISFIVITQLPGTGIVNVSSRIVPSFSVLYSLFFTED